MARRTAMPVTTNALATTRPYTDAALQLSGNVDGTEILAGLAAREADAAQLRVLVYETKKRLTAALELELETLATLDAAAKAAQKVLDDAVAAFDVTGRAEEFRRYVTGLEVFGFNPTAITTKVGNLDCDRGEIAVHFSVQLGNVVPPSKPVFVVASAAIVDLAMARDAADTVFRAQYAAVRVRREDLASNEIEEIGQNGLDLRTIERATDAQDRAATLEALVGKFVTKSADRADKVRGVKQLTKSR